MSELLPEKTDFTYEEQYRAAGWKSVIDIMAKVGIARAINPDLTSITTLERLCGKANKDSSGILPFVKSYYRPPNHLDPTSLTEAGILSEKRISASDYRYPVNPDFEMAVILFNEHDNTAREIRRDYNLERLNPYIEQMTDLFIPDALESFKNGISLSETLHDIHHESTFRIGMYDNDDQLDTQHVLW